MENSAAVRVICLTVVCVILTFAGCAITLDRQVLSAQDPVAAACAVRGDNPQARVCDVVKYRK